MDALAADVSSLGDDVRDQKITPFIGPETSFKIVVDGFGKIFNAAEQMERIESLTFVPFQVRMTPSRRHQVVIGDCPYLWHLMTTRSIIRWMTGRISERGGGAAEDRFFSFRALPREDDQPAMANHSSYFLFHACGGWMDVERRLTWKSNRLSGMQSEYIHCCPSLLLAHSGHPSPPSPLLFPFTPLHGSPQGPVNLTRDILRRLKTP